MPKEYIERGVLIKKLNEAPAYFESGDIRYGIDIATQEIIKQPTADVVEVTYCRDCICFELTTSNNQHFCNRFGGSVTENDYCSRPRPKNRKDK